MARPSTHLLRSWLPICLLLSATHSVSAGGMQDTLHPGSERRPSQWAVPAATLALGCLKPAVGAIGRLDDRVYERISPSGPVSGFHIESALQWTPTASV